MARVVDGLVICIDELDKVVDPSQVASLLRDIKGIFEIPGVYFLVSISDEAARSLELGTVRERNEFSSSFYTIVRVSDLDEISAMALVQRRSSGIHENIARVCNVLAGGLPRELVRFSEEVQWQTKREVHDIAMAIAAGESEAFRAELLAIPPRAVDGQSGDFEHDKLRVDRLLAASLTANSSNEERSPEGEQDRGNQGQGWDLGKLLAWDLDSPSSQWVDGLQEQWRRLLVRLAVADLLCARPELATGAPAGALRDVVRTASHSALVARNQLVLLIIGLAGARSTNSEFSEPHLSIIIRSLKSPAAPLRPIPILPHIKTKRDYERYAKELSRAGLLKRKLRIWDGSSWTLVRTEEEQDGVRSGADRVVAIPQGAGGRW